MRCWTPTSTGPAEPVALPRPSFRVWLLLLLVALGGVLVLLDSRSVREPGAVPRDAAGEPDFFLEGARLTRFDAEGLAHQRLDTPRLVHTPHDDVTRLEAPDARLYDRAGRGWLAEADSGVLGPGGNPLTLPRRARLPPPQERWRLDTEGPPPHAGRGPAWGGPPAPLQPPPPRLGGRRSASRLHPHHAPR